MSLIEEMMKEELFSRQLTLKRGEQIKQEESVDTNIYWIEQGCIRIYFLDGEEERTIRFGYSGNIIVSLDSFLNEQPSDFILEAIKGTKIRVASKAVFMELVHRSEEHMKAWIFLLEDLVLQQVEREKDLLIQAPRVRYERVLKRSPRLFQEVPARYIANYLRMTPETLSRLRKS